MLEKQVPDIVEPSKEFIIGVLNFEDSPSILIRQYFNFFRERKGLSIKKEGINMNPITASFWFYTECEDYAKEMEWI